MNFYCKAGRRGAWLLTGVLFLLPSAHAADPVTTRDSTELEEIVVTGSRIATPNGKSTSPIQVVSARDIQITGKTDISDIINQLPQNFNNDLGQDLGNRTSGLTTAGGVATADLRGLGPQRTLVLVNGRRLGQGSPYTFIQSPAPDLDQIPTALVERVEVLTGGASSTYGSDAIAGVVNFIMKKDFEGLQFDGNLGENWHSNHNSYTQQRQREFGQTPLTGTSFDGRTKAINVLAGANFSDGKGNVTAYFGYMKTDPVSSADRDFGGCQLNPNGDLRGAHCAGSSNSNYFNPLTGPNANSGPYSVLGTDFIPSDGTTPTTPPQAFNSQRYIFMSRGDQRYTAGFMAHIDLNEHLKPYAEFGFMNDRTHQEVAPAALFRNSNPNDTLSLNYNINCSNPLLSDQQAHILCSQAQIDADRAALAAGGRPVTANVEIGRRNVEGGVRFSDYEHTNYRAVLGAGGDLGKAWNYDAYAQYYYTTFYTANEKYLNFAAVDNALLVTKDANGNPVCISGGSCVPYNIFKDGGVTADQLNYLYLAGTGYGTTTLRTVHADITGQLGDYGLRSPLASDGLAVNLGYEHRNENVSFEPDGGLTSGQLSGFGSAAVGINNGVSVDEQFLELRAPLVQDKTGIKDLLFDTGFRRSNYSSTGNVNTYKFEVQYAPSDDLRFRGSYQRAVRAPSVIELYNGNLVGLVQGNTDPCAPTIDPNTNAIIPAARSLQECLRSVPTAEQAQFTQQYGNGGTTNIIPQAVLGQLSQITGGNAHLKNERGDSYSYGLNFTPRALPNFSGSIDYFRIKLADGIGVIPFGVILNNCLESGDPTYCKLIVRQHNTGSLTGATITGGGYVDQTNYNVGAAQITGIDLQNTYKVDLPARWGSLAFAMNGAYQLKNEATPLPGAHTYDCSGLYGFVCQTVNPKWHHILRTTWQTPWQVTASLTWRYIGSVKLDNNDADPYLHFATDGGYNYFNARIPSFSYFDLAGTWNVASNFELRGGINNLFDKDPPLATVELVSGGAANTFSTYDALGRQLFLAFTAKF